MPMSSMLPLGPGAPIWSATGPNDRDRPGAGLASGHDFASLDPLVLTRDAAVQAAARAALHRRHLVATQGGADPDPPRLAAGLAGRIARFVALPTAITFASGEAAIRATLRGLLRPGDQVIVDAGSHPAMFETVRASAARFCRSPAGSFDAVERRLTRLTRQRQGGRILVAVPAVARLSSVSVHLADLVALCAVYRAVLVVDVSQDLGLIGQTGRGLMEVEGCLGRVDVVHGGLDEAFGTTGGFAAFRDPSLQGKSLADPLDGARVPPLLAAFDLLDSAEGQARRRRLHGNALRLRNHLMADGLRVMGQPSPVVPVRLDPQTARALTALLRSAGPVVPLLQAPVVAGRAPRWHIRPRSDHGPADIDNLAELIHDASRSLSRRIRLRPKAQPPTDSPGPQVLGVSPPPA